MLKLCEISCYRQLWNHLDEAEQLIYTLQLSSRGDILGLEIVDKLREMRNIIKEDLQEQGSDLE